MSSWDPGIDPRVRGCGGGPCSSISSHLISSHLIPSRLVPSHHESMFVGQVIGWRMQGAGRRGWRDRTIYLAKEYYTACNVRYGTVCTVVIVKCVSRCYYTAHLHRVVARGWSTFSLPDRLLATLSLPSALPTLYQTVLLSLLAHTLAHQDHHHHCHMLYEGSPPRLAKHASAPPKGTPRRAKSEIGALNIVRSDHHSTEDQRLSQLSNLSLPQPTNFGQLLSQANSW